MFGIDHGALLCGGCDQCAAGQVIGFSKQPAGALLDSGDSGLVKKILFHPCDGQMMFEILFHSGKVAALQVASGDDARSQRLGGTIGQFVDEVVLAGYCTTVLWLWDCPMPFGAR